MERLIIHESDEILELNGFVLQNGDEVELGVLGSWIAGSVAHDQRGWYLRTSEHAGIRLRTGLAARILWLAPEPVFWQQGNQAEPEEPMNLWILR